jgi:5-methylcytosine-specific restriction protein B
MSRYCGASDSGGTLRAAERWRRVALEADGSVFTDTSLWTAKNIDSLHEYFVENLDWGEGGFIEKLKSQLDGSPPETARLAAEMLWAMRLCPGNIKASTKRDQALEIWSWSGSRLPSQNEWLQDDVLQGVGSAGTAFNTNLWRELVFMVRLMREFKALSGPDKAELLGDGWKLAEWLEQIPECDVRQVRHMLLFMLFPDDFERIFGGNDRKRILVAFTGTSMKEAKKLSAVEIDAKLAEIRESQEEQDPDTQLDFYEDPLHAQWIVAGPEQIKSITHDHVLAAISDIDRDDIPDEAQSTFYDLVQNGRRYPPKLVVSLAAKHATGQELYRSLFAGGEKSVAFRHLRKLGFKIEPKRLLADSLESFIRQADDGADLAYSGYMKRYRDLSVRVSFGKGNFAKVPWVSFTGFGQTTQHGIYPVVLYYKSAGVLVLAYGISETHLPERSWNLPPSTPTVASYLSREFSFKPERYGASFVWRAYKVDEDLDLDAVASEIDGLIERFIQQMEEGPEPDETEPIKYEVEDALEELFLLREHFESMIRLLRSKKNVILQGPPGVGKTFVCKRLAYAAIGAKDDDRVVTVQFHQTYSYEDFVQGYRPSDDGFSLRDGVFHQFCTKASEDPSRDYVFIIDEINRGNLSKIFGELLMLMEGDKRGPEWAVPLTYGEGPDDRFFVPENLFIIGLMNTADRSLAMVDYALRRRFGFIDVLPGFETEQFRTFLLERGGQESFVDQIIDRLASLNVKIASDTANLGPGYRIGHSFFSVFQDGEKPDVNWYERVVRSEIGPLLREYWFDDSARAAGLVEELLL